MKILLRFLLAIGIMFIISSGAFSNTEKWKLYENKVCGYRISLPVSSQINPITKSLRTSFYFNPLQYLDNLKNFPAFKNTTVDENCVTQIVFPIQPNTNLTGKFLFIYKLNNMPKKWPPPIPGVHPENKGKLVNLQGKNFFLVNDSDTGMCHEYQYQYYFTQQKGQYYVLELFFKAHCLGVSDSNEKQYDKGLESFNLDKVISSFEVI